MVSLRRLGVGLSMWICVFALGSVSIVQAQESLDTVQLEEIAVFGTGITQNDLRYNEFLVSPDQRHIAVLSTDTTLRSSDIIEVWALDTQSLVTVMDRPFGAAGFGVFAWSPDSSQLATIISDEELFIWDALTGELVRTHVGLDIFSNGVRSIAWHQPDTITTGSFEYVIWDLNSDTAPRIVNCHPWGSGL